MDVRAGAGFVLLLRVIICCTRKLPGNYGSVPPHEQGPALRRLHVILLSARTGGSRKKSVADRLRADRFV